MYSYPSPIPYLHPLPYPHHLTARSLDTYMYKTAPQPRLFDHQPRTSNYYPRELPYRAHPPTSHLRPVQTQSWRQDSHTQADDRILRKSSLKKKGPSRHVHFELPVQASSHKNQHPAPEEQETRQKYTSQEQHQNSSFRTPYYSRQQQQHPDPVRTYYTRREMADNYKISVHHHHHHLTREERWHDEPRKTTTTSHNRIPPEPLPPPTLPTIYIITFSTDLTTNSTTAVNHLLTSQLPARNPPIPHLYTIDARSMRPPPPSLCEKYSGISPLIQDIVMQDRGARKAAKMAVRDLLRFREEEEMRRRKERGRQGRGKMEVSMSVCCHAGTHRSVGIAERIAQCVRSEVGRLGVDEGVRVVCRHVHRVKGRGDPF